jgi:hypothetical protein
MAKMPKETELPPPPGPPGGLGDKIESTAQRAFGALLNRARETLVDILAGGIELFLEVIEQALASRLAPTIDKALEAPDLPDNVRAFLTSIKAPTSQADAIGGMGFGAQMGMSAASGFLAPISRTLNYWMDRSIHSARPDPGVAWATYWRGLVSRQDVRDALADLGWSEEATEAWGMILKPRLSPIDLIAYQRLFGGSFANVVDELTKRGYTEHEAGFLEKLSRYVPSPPDLVRMQVREAWNPGVISKWGYDQGDWSQFKAWMKKLGDEGGEWADKFWYAHWEIPSITFGMEMLHRDIITEGEFDTLLHILDVAPGWRDKIKAVSYHPFTRVDIRRMYQAEFVDRARVKRTYQDLGLNDADAELMTQWVEDEYGPEGKELTKADILDAHLRGVIGDSDAVGMLTALGYTSEAAMFYVARNHLKRAEALSKQELSVVKRLYENGLITESDARERMAALNLLETQVNTNLELWTITREAKVRRPGVAKVESFYKDDVITAEQLRGELDIHGYNADYVTWYIQALDAEKAEAAARETERARKEEERVRLAEVKTAYEEAVAVLNVEIALQRFAIASAQQALNAALSTTEIRGVEAERERLTVEIASERAEIRRLREAGITAREQLRLKIGTVEREKHEAAITDARAQVAALTGEIAATETQISRLREATFAFRRPDRIAGAEAEIAARRTEVTEHRREMAAHATEIRRLKEALFKMEEPAEIEAAKAGVLELQTMIAEVREEIAMLEVEMDRWHEVLLTLTDEDALAETKETIAGLGAVIAEHREAIAEQRRLEGLAREALRVKIPDAERLELETVISETRAGIAEHETHVAELQERRAILKLALVEEITADARADLEAAIAEAYKEITRLRVEKAQLKVGV